MANIKVNFGNGTIVLSKSKKYVGVKQQKTQTRGFGEAPSVLDASVKEVLHPSLGGFKVVAVAPPTGQRGFVNSQLDDIRSLDEVQQGTHVYHIEGSEKPLVPTGSIYITFGDKVTKKQQEALLNQRNLLLKTRRSATKIIAKVTAQSLNPLKCAASLQRLKSVERAEPDMDTPLDFCDFDRPTAKLWGNLWHLENTGRIADNPRDHIMAGADAKVVDAWKLLDGYGNPNITIAIIDNGIDTDHPDLATKVVKPTILWEGSIVNELTSYYNHGTSCASVAVSPNDGGVCGSAPAARLMPISGTGFDIEITEKMFNYCLDNGADIISCSWGTPDRNFVLGQEKKDALAKAAKEGRDGKGCIILFASGNDFNDDVVNVYGEHPDVICVGASTSEDERAPYSNAGSALTLVAPSNGGFVPIMAARASWDDEQPQYQDDIDRGPRYKHFGGTSSATPLVAGICALMLSANPNLTAKEVKQILCDTADKIGDPSEYTDGHSFKFGYGRVNAGKAVQEALKRI